MDARKRKLTKVNRRKQKQTKKEKQEWSRRIVHGRDLVTEPSQKLKIYSSQYQRRNKRDYRL